MASIPASTGIRLLTSAADVISGRMRSWSGSKSRGVFAHKSSGRRSRASFSTRSARAARSKDAGLNAASPTLAAPLASSGLSWRKVAWASASHGVWRSVDMVERYAAVPSLECSCAISWSPSTALTNPAVRRYFVLRAAPSARITRSHMRFLPARSSRGRTVESPKVVRRRSRRAARRASPWRGHNHLPHSAQSSGRGTEASHTRMNAGSSERHWCLGSGELSGERTGW
mmetsp:Transcript_11584/g.26599  ORF Transcript_11584/g.26599 Transcript_11584/m.26599 type:complete len:229 (-) Transcript_11584:347-1033(-)